MSMAMSILERKEKDENVWQAVSREEAISSRRRRRRAMRLKVNHIRSTVIGNYRHKFRQELMRSQDDPLSYLLYTKTTLGTEERIYYYKHWKSKFSPPDLIRL